MSERVIVVGAGVIGAGVGLELARAGYEVTVVDQASAPGHGSTGASSAIIRYHYRHRDEAVLAWESGRRWMHWADYLGATDPTGMARFVKTGLLVLPGDVLDMTDALDNLRELDIEVDPLSPEELRARFPAIDPTRFGPPALPGDDAFWAERSEIGTAYWIPECGYVDDPQLAAHNLANAAESIGVAFRFNSRVTGIVRRNGRVAGVTLADGQRIEAAVVVNVAGPWSRSLNQLAGVLDDFNASTTPLEQEVISMPAPAGFGAAEGVCVTDADFGTYFRPAPGNTVVVGGMEAPCDPLRWLDNPEQARNNVSGPTWEMQSQRVARRMPTTQVPARARGIVGVYDVTQDWIPIYDRTNLDGYYVAIGTSGHGFKQAPFVGELMAGLITACEAGHPHDSEPLVVAAPWTGRSVNLGHFSRLRTVAPQAAMG